MKAVLYCRVSSEEQAKGFSLDAQEAAGIDYARKQGIKIMRTFKVAESAASEGREAFNEAMRWTRQHQDVQIILVFKLDRGIRNLQDLAALDELVRRHHKEIHFFHEGWKYTTESTVADFYRFGFMGTMATGYSRNLSDITKVGMKRKAESGQYPGNPPYGYRTTKDRKLEPRPDQAPWVTRIKQLAAAGVSIENIMARLKAEGCTDPFYTSKIERIINSMVYSGIFTWGGISYRAAFPSIVPMDLHQDAVAGLQRLHKPKKQAQDIAYRGLMTCACGAAVCGEKHSGKSYDYDRYTYYRCRARCKGSFYVNEKVLDQQFEAALMRIHITQDQAAGIMAGLELESGRETALRESKLATLRADNTRLRNRIERAYDDKLDGKLSESEWVMRTGQWKAQLLAQEQEIAKVETDMTDAAQTLREIVELVDLLKNQFKSLSGEKKGKIVDCVLSNPVLEGAMVSFTFEKPWDAIVAIAEEIKLGPKRDDVRTPQIQQLLIKNQVSLRKLTRTTWLQ